MIGERPQRPVKSPTAKIDLPPNLSRGHPKLCLPVSDWSAGGALNIHWLRAMGERQWCWITAAGAAQARTRNHEEMVDGCDA